MSHRILIIDDEEDIRDVAALSLETVAGWDVVVASSGAQGLARAIEHLPEAILLDVMMPGMDGPTTLRELRKKSGRHQLRVLYAFDPQRDAVLLIGGDKTGDDRFYETHVPRAERVWERYLTDQRRHPEKEKIK